jgi:DNA (cytosine-5)-methyltransferase 1
MEKKSGKIIGVDLFAGAGGLSLGARWAGIDVSYAVELDTSAATTYKNNHPGCVMLNCDIAKVTKKNIPVSFPFIIFGGPPCQGFSTSNQKTRTSGNPKNSLSKHFIRLIAELKPDWVVFENVKGIVSFQKGTVVDGIVSELEELNYFVVKKIVDAVDFGVPQYRKRFVLIANKKNILFKFPENKSINITVKEAIGDLPSLNNGEKLEISNYKKDYFSGYIKLMRKKSEFPIQNYVSRNKPYVIERYKYIKQGQNWQSIPKSLMENYNDISKCHSGIYRRLSYNEPSVTISNYRKNMLIHPFEDRGLSVREAARLQSFPDTFIFSGLIGEIQQQIGNAVPPLFAKAIFDRIMEYEKQEKS